MAEGRQNFIPALIRWALIRWGLIRWGLLGGLVFALQLAVLAGGDVDHPEPAGDVAEVFNLAWSLAHGRGYQMDWNDPLERDQWHSRDTDGELRFFTIRRGSHPAMSRPPLMPLAMAAMLLFHPAHPFQLWKEIDAALFSAAAALLTQGVLHRFGWRAALAMLPLTLLDQLRAYYVPGMWTEGLAFDGMAVLVWLVLRGGSGSTAMVLVGGITLGLLCLDRAFFVLVSPLLCLIVAEVGPARWKSASLMLGIAVAIQLPWWTRNVAVAHRFVPLGTQGGINLPDEYSDEAVLRRGLWTGHEMNRLWAATAVTAQQRAERARPQVLALWPGEPDFAAVIDAVNCESLQTELDVADVGQRAGLRWIRTHPLQLPRLFIDKLITQTIAARGWLTLLVGFGCGTLLADPPRRRLAARVALLGVAYAVGIGLTHAVAGRFLVPVLPPLYVLAAAGTGEWLRRLLRVG